MVDLALLQSVSYMAGAIGVCVAAAYYVMNLRNAERDRQRQTILLKLPPINREYYEWNLQIRNNPTPPEREWDTKIRVTPELESKIQYIMNIYGTVGLLYGKGLMSLEEVADLYSPGWMISWYHMFEFLIDRIRAVYPDYLAHYERLVGDLNSRYPGAAENIQKMGEESRRLMETTGASRTSLQ
jgi:hypothetical protein